MDLQDALQKLKSLSDTLQKRDIEAGFGSDFFTGLLEQYQRNRTWCRLTAINCHGEHYPEYIAASEDYMQNGNYALGELLTDAWNCNLITDQEYDALEEKLTLDPEYFKPI